MLSWSFLKNRYIYRPAISSSKVVYIILGTLAITVVIHLKRCNVSELYQNSTVTTQKVDNDWKVDRYYLFEL